MGKKYVKPSITFSKLSMGTEVYGRCATEINCAEFVCPVIIPELGETVFQENNCDWASEDMYVCYHVPMANMNVFGS